MADYGYGRHAGQPGSAEAASTGAWRSARRIGRHIGKGRVGAEQRYADPAGLARPASPGNQRLELPIVSERVEICHRTRGRWVRKSSWY